MADFYGTDKGKSWWSDAGVIYPELPLANGETPSQNTQGNNATNPTVVQPFVVVPYVSQMQPLYQYENNPAIDYTEYDSEDMLESDYLEEGATTRPKIYISKIFVMLLSLISIAVLVLGKFVSLDFLNIYGTNYGLSIIMGVSSVISVAEIMPMIITFGIMGVALFSVLVFIVSALTITRTTKIIKRVLCALQLICIIAIVVALTRVTTFSDIGYGTYILAGISVVSFII